MKIGIGMNRYVQHMPEIETTGWDASLPRMHKSMGTRVADAAVASALDSHPLIGSPDSENLRIAAWKEISKVLSRGHAAVIDKIEKRTVGIEKNGEILLTGISDLSSISEINRISWKVVI